MKLIKHRTKDGHPWWILSLCRSVRKEYGDHFTFYLRLGRYVIEINFGRDRKEVMPPTKPSSDRG